jgi:hypothetical protein
MYKVAYYPIEKDIRLPIEEIFPLRLRKFALLRGSRAIRGFGLFQRRMKRLRA